MGMIDEKGRIFGKINIIDLSVILFLFCLLPIFYFGYRIWAKEHLMIKAVKREYYNVQIKCKLVKLEPEVLKLIRAGDQEHDENGRAIGEIAGLGSVEPYQFEIDIGGGEKIIKQHEDLLQIVANLKLSTTMKESGVMHYNAVPLILGLPLMFKTDKYEIEAIVLGIPEILLKEKMIELPVVLKDLDDQTLKQISVGDKELDGGGKLVAEILDLGKIKPSSSSVHLGANYFAVESDNQRKQVYAKMRLRCQARGWDQYYFKGQRIQRNTPLEFKTDKYILTGLPTRSFEVSPAVKKWLSLKVEFSRMHPTIADAIEAGDIESNSEQEPVARITSIIENRAAEEMTLGQYKFVTEKHPFYRSVLIAIDFLCEQKEGDYYYKGSPVKMGLNIDFATDLYSISGLIVGKRIK
jgi:hypothetical protein